MQAGYELAAEAVLSLRWKLRVADKSKEHMMVVAAKSEVVERSFVNQRGERWLLRVELRSGDAVLFGDEADWIRGIQIRNDVVAPDYILADDEARWLATAWFELTGRELVLPVFNRMQAGESR